MEQLARKTTYPLVEPGTVIESAHRLEPLSETDDERVGEHADTGDDGHARDGGVAVGPGRYVQQDSGHTGQSLPEDGRTSAVDDFLQESRLGGKVPVMDADILSLAIHQNQHQEAAYLADKGRPGGSGDTHVEDENQQRVEPDIQYGAYGDADHGIYGIPLETHLVVQYQRRGHERRSQQHDSQVGFGVEEDGFGRPQQLADGGQEEQPQCGDEYAADKGAEESGRSHLLGTLVIAGSQPPGNEISGSVSEEEPDGLDDGHDGEGNTYGSRRLGVDLTYEIGVGHDVERGDEHADDGRYRQRADEAGYRHGSHKGVFICAGLVHYVED